MYKFSMKSKAKRLYGSDIPLIYLVKEAQPQREKPFSIDVKGGEVTERGRIADRGRIAYRGSVTKLTKVFHQ
jgi:hypothetical protein